MAAIRETLTLEDAFSANFTRYIALGQQAAGASDLASTAARNYQSVANSLDRKLISLNAQFAVLAQEQQAMVAAGRQNTTAFATLDAKVERLGGTIRETQAQYDAVVSQMERAQTEAKKAASATEELAASQQKARASSSALSASLGQQAAGGFNLAANTARSYESTASRLSRQLDALNTRLAATAQAQLSMVAAGRQNTAAFAALGAQAEQLSGSIQETQAQYDAAVSQMERAQIEAKKAASATEELSQSQKRATSSSNAIGGSLKSLIGTYISLQTLKGLFTMSDTLALTTARLNMMNDGLQTTAQLNAMVYQSAQRARGSYAETADFVAKLGTLAGDAFGSSQEIIAFAEQINKQMKLSGATTQGAQAAMLQLTQALSSGTLRGEELNSVLEQTPMIAQTIANYLGVSTGQMREMASEGKITAQVIKNAMFSAAEETNAAFEDLPLTWADIWTQIQNQGIMALQPLFDALNQLANSQFVQDVVNWITVSLYGIGIAAQFVANNIEIIGPIVLTITAAFIGYKAAVLACAGVTKALSIAHGIQAAAATVAATETSGQAAAATAAATATSELAGAATVAAGATVGLTTETTVATGATIGLTNAQSGLNAAMAANPIGLIIVLIVALVAAFVWLWDNVEAFRNYWIESTSASAESWLWFYNDVVVPVGNGIITLLNQTGAVIQDFAELVVNAFADAAQFLVKNFQFVADNAKGFMNWYNAIAGALGWKQINVDFAVSPEGIEAARQSALASISKWGIEGGIQEIKPIDEDTYLKNLQTLKEYAADFRIGDFISEKMAELTGVISGSVEDLYNLDGIGSDYGEQIVGELGNIADSVNSVDKTVSMSDEDIKSLVDMAERRYVTNVNLTSQTPVINIHGANTGNTEADRQALADAIDRVLTEQMAYTAFRATAVPT